MKKIIVILWLLSIPLWAQKENNTQSIELPDFVITGKQKITMPKFQKKEPDFIPLLSKDFFNPKFPSEEEIQINLSKQKIEEVNIFDKLQGTNGLIKASGGLYTLPKLDVFYGNWINNFSYGFHLFGLQERKYIDYAGITNYGGSLGTKYFVKQDAKVLPGMEVSFNGNYKLEKYNFFGSAFPKTKRETNFANADISVNFTSNGKFQFGFELNDNYYEQVTDTISENIFGTKGFMQFRLMNMDLKIEGTYKNQSINKTKLHFGNTYYFNTIATASLNLYRRINIKAGAYIAESNNNTFFSPIAYGSFKLTNYITLLGEFSPFAELQTMKNFVSQNRYYKLNNFVNSFVENKVNIKFAVRFEYEQYFEINGGIGYLNSDNDVYFVDEDNDGFFNALVDDTENTYIFLNALFRKGPGGEFYGELKVQDVRDSDNKKVPYAPTLLADFTYMYNISSKLGTKIKLDFHNGTHTDKGNTLEIPKMVNISLSAYYKLFRNFNFTFTLENLLDNKYYYYQNYKAKPFDILAGFEYRF